MFYFHKVAHVHYLGEVDIFSYMSKKFLPLYNSAKIIIIDRDFPKLWSQMYCHLFLCFTVYIVYNTKHDFHKFQLPSILNTAVIHPYDHKTAAVESKLQNTKCLCTNASVSLHSKYTHT